jgi:hypothetical protein
MRLAVVVLVAGRVAMAAFLSSAGVPALVLLISIFYQRGRRRQGPARPCQEAGRRGILAGAGADFSVCRFNGSKGFALVKRFSLLDDAEIRFY